MSTDEFVELIGDWTSLRSSLSASLAHKVGKLVSQGKIHEGTYLPPERVLANALCVSRTTVTAAYHLLRSEGLIESRVGKGTWVKALSMTEDRYDLTPDYGAASEVLYSDFGGSPSREFDLTWAAPLAGPWIARSGPGALQVLVELAKSSVGYEPAGIMPLRRRIAELLNRNVPTRPEQIIITTGGTQAIFLALQKLSLPGERVLVEELTCPSALSNFRSRRLRVEPVSMDSSGLTSRSFEAGMKAGSAAFLYVTPTNHNPTGANIPSERRQEIVSLAERYACPILEDLSLSDLSFGDQDTTPLAALSRTDTVYSVGSLSKLYWPGLRVGWLRVPDADVSDIVGEKSVEDFGTSFAGQALALSLLDEFDLVKNSRRLEYERKSQYLRDMLATYIPSWEPNIPDGGLSLWVDTGVEVDPLRQRALRRGLRLLTDAHFQVVPKFEGTRHIRLPFTLPEAALRSLAIGLAEIA